MNSDEYKRLCNQPNAFSRRDLEITEKTLREKNHSVAQRLSEILQTLTIKKPENHKGNKSTDYFLISLSESDVDRIVDVFTDLEVENAETDGITTSLASFYGEIADKWMNYLATISS